MIFVTVGTHEQQFNRLIREIDRLIGNSTINEPVFMQIGYSTFIPQHCKWSKFVTSKQMKSFMKMADVIITHGGPSSFVEAMAAGKMPVVVPRRADFDEHVNNHQADFVRIVAERKGGIIPVYDVDDLPTAIREARLSSQNTKFQSNNANFCEKLSDMIGGL